MATVLVEQNVPARMRDGVTLYADVYRPFDDDRHPVLLTRLPYGKAGVASLLSPVRVAQAGYAVVVQDCRGTGASEGHFGYFATLGQEGPDGYDTVEWAAGLPYSDGNVGMFGLSYFGWTQWAAAAQRPPHLRAIAPMQTWSDHRLVPSGYRGGAFELGNHLSWHLGMAVGQTTKRLAASGAAPAEIQAAMGRLVATIDRLSYDGYFDTPLRDLPSLREIGLNTILSYLFDAGPGGEFPGSTIDLSSVEVPSLSVGGWHDVLLQPTLDGYVGARARGRGLARQARLLVGPWTHGDGMMSGTQGEMSFGMASSGLSIGMREDLVALTLRWSDHWLRGVDNGIDREPPVQVFVTGVNRWIPLGDWPPAGAMETPLYLGSGGALGPMPSVEREASSRYTYDPASPAPTLGGATLLPQVYRAGVKDQRPLSARSDVLTFTAPALDTPLAVIGPVSADLWVSSSAPDTDFVVRLVDVHPDGYMENVCDGITRARYRESSANPSFLEPGRVYGLSVDLWSTAHTFGVGHRVAVQVTSSSFPRWDRNWNTREDPAAATSGQPAEQTIWHDAARPSRILLPEVQLG